MTHGKMIDDASIAESIDMDSVLTTQPEDYWIRPLSWRERFELGVPASLNKTIAELYKMTRYADMHYMRINPKKTKVLNVLPQKERN